MSRMPAVPQFQTWIGQPSSLDRCNRCPAPRSAHGPDWSCPAGLQRRSPFAFLAAGGVLTAISLVLKFTVGWADFTAQTVA